MLHVSGFWSQENKRSGLFVEYFPRFSKCFASLRFENNLLTKLDYVISKKQLIPILVERLLRLRPSTFHFST